MAAPETVNPVSASSDMNNSAATISVPEEQLDETHQAALQSEKGHQPLVSPVREFLFLATVCMSQFFTQIGVGQALVLLNVVGDHFGLTSPGEKSWFIAGYSLTVGTFILFSGKLGDVYGHKLVLTVGYAWFSLWSIVAGLAVYSDHVLFDFARVLSGIGPALCMPNAVAILGTTYAPGTKKAVVFAMYGAMAPIGSILGAIFGGVFNLVWWPWAFWSTGIALALVALASVAFVPDWATSTDGSETTFWQSLTKIDLPGTMLGVTALVLINFAWNQAPIVGWQSAYIIVTMILGFTLLAAFFYFEIKLAKRPLIAFNALNSDVGFILAVLACGWACFGIWYFYLVQTAIVLQGNTPILAAAKVTPVIVSGSGAAILTGIFLPRLGPSLTMFLALTAFTVGTVLIATMPLDQIYWGQMFFSTVITPFGMDMSFPAATLIISNAVEREHQGIAASLCMTVINYSISLGLGFAGTIEGHVNHGGNTIAEIHRGYRGAFYFGIGVAGLGMFVSAVFGWKSQMVRRVSRSDDQELGL